MVDITIKYKPFIFLPWRVRVKTRLPEKWSELTEKQFISILNFKEKKISEARLLLVFLCKEPLSRGMVDDNSKYSILRHLNFINEPATCKDFLIKRILKLKSPETGLKNITFGAFIKGDDYYNSYISGEKDDLNRFIACFYLSGEIFNQKCIEDKADKIKRVNIRTREMIATNYGFIRQWLINTFPYAFSIVNEVYRIYKTKTLFDFALELSEYNIENYLKYASISLHKVLLCMNEMRKARGENLFKSTLNIRPFLDPAEVKVPSMNVFAPNDVILSDGTRLDPTEN